MRYKVLDLKSHDPSQPPVPIEGKYSHMECDAVRETQPTISEACSFDGLPGAAGPQPAKIDKLEALHESLCASFVRFVSLWWDC
jgi:hypothetical protein